MADGRPPGWRRLQAYEPLFEALQRRYPGLFPAIAEAIRENREWGTTTSGAVVREFPATRDVGTQYVTGTNTRNVAVQCHRPTATRTIGTNTIRADATSRATQTTPPPARTDSYTQTGADRVIIPRRPPATTEGEAISATRTSDSYTEARVTTGSYWRPVVPRPTAIKREIVSDTDDDGTLYRPSMAPARPSTAPARSATLPARPTTSRSQPTLSKPDHREGCWNCGKTTHRYSSCPYPIKGAMCFRCGQRGVTIKTCPKCGPAWEKEPAGYGQSRVREEHFRRCSDSESD